MAKNKVQTMIEIDIVTKGIESAEKAISNIDSSQGELYKHAQKVTRAIDKIREITNEYGENIPIAKAKELAKLMRIISEETADMASMDEVVIFNKKELDTLKKLEDSIDAIKTKIKNLKKEKATIPVKMEQERVSELKTQKTAKGADGKSVSLDALKNGDGSSKFETRGDLESLSKSADPKVAKAASAALHQLDITAAAAAEKVAKLDEEYQKLNATLQAKNEEYNNLSTSVKTLTDEEKAAYETVSKFTESQVKNIERATDASQKQGQEFVKTTKIINAQNATLGKAVKSLFSWTAVWNLGKRMLKEAVNTVTEMDKALTGMAVVTSMSRDETNALIPRIQELARATSTAMTEVADLITEYTRQGRSLEESFILAEETAKAAKIAGISAADSIQYMTSAINGFNLAATEATRVSDIFANLAAVSATDYEQLAIALSKVSAQANLAGMSIEYTTALLAKGIEVTQEAPESIGTALKTIVARMRELSDYGKTLEDGASVNKVESALAAAGIELRDVNGEFRDLEDIFNELGPKWDKLNTMQQQAIAQAVAGTRQQSRFVAIMQDWERTQELAAEAQDSAGASAAQYAEQAKGIEAAMTNLTTAWQSFIQSLTSSKFIITVINLATGLIDGLTKVMSIGGEFTKSFVAGVISVVAVMKVLQKISQFREAVANFIARNTEDESEAAEKTSAERKKTLEYEKTILQLKLKQNEAELNKSYDDVEKLDNSDETNDEDYIAAYQKQTELLQEQKNLKEQIGVIDQNLSADVSNTVQLEYNLRQRIAAMENEAQLAEITKLDNQIEANNLLEQEMALKYSILEQEKLITAEKIAQLQAELQKLDADDPANTERRAQLTSQISKLTSEQENRTKAMVKLEEKSQKIAKKGQKLETKRNKLVSGEYKTRNKTFGIMKQLTNKVLKKFGVNTTKIEKGWNGIKSLFGKVKGDGEANNINLNKLLQGQQKSVKNYDDMLKTGSLIIDGEEKRKLSAEELTEISNRKIRAEESIKNIQAAQQDLGTEGLVTQKQAGQLLNTEKMTQQSVLTIQQGQSAAESAENAQTAAGLPAEVSEAGANISAAASQPYGTGVPLALMGVAALAAVGLAGGLAGIISNSGGQQSARDVKIETKISESQNTMYDAKKQNQEISESKDRFIELTSKGDLTIEEQEELDELTSSIQDLDDSFANKTGPDLIDAMDDLMLKNENLIDKEIDASYQLALKMDNLGKSELGRQAIENKLISTQEDLIASNDKLAFANQEIINSVTEKTQSMADSFADNISQTKFGENEGYTASEAVDDGLRHLVFSAVPVVGPFLAVGNSIHSGIQAITETVEKIKEQREFAAYMNTFAQNSVDFAAEMENFIAAEDANGEAIHSFGDQVEAYAKNLEIYATDDYMKDIFAKEYKTLDFIAQFLPGSEDNTVESQYKSQVLDNIDKLTELGTLTTQDIEKLAEVFANLDQKQENYTKAEEMLVDYNLVDVANKFGLDGRATAESLKKAMMSTVNQSDGEYSRHWDNSDEKNAYKFGSAGRTWVEDTAVGEADYGYSDEYLTNIVDEVLPQLQEMGLGSATFDEIIAYNKLASQYMSPDAMFAEYIDTLTDKMSSGTDDIQALYDAKTESELNSYINDLEKSANMWKKAMEDARAANDKETYNKARAAYQAANNEAVELKKQIDEATRSMAGYMNSKDLNDFIDKAKSASERIQDLREAALEQEFFDTEQLEMLENDIIPTLQKEFGIEFDTSQFIKNVQEGTTEGLRLLAEYERIAAEQNLEKVEDNVKAHREEIKDLEEEYADSSIDKARRNEIEASLKTEKAALAIAEVQLENYKKQLEALSGMTSEERKRYNLQNKLARLEDKEDINSMQQKIELLKEIRSENNKALDEEYDKLLKGFGQGSNITKNQLQSILQVKDGVVTLTDAYDDLGDEEKEWIKNSLENFEEVADEYQSTVDDLNSSYEEFYNKQIESQSQLIDAYKSKLEEEQEALQSSLEKRQEMYDKYFDALDEQDSDESFEEQQARLQKAIASLSTATDATSLSQLKEYQEQLQDLEDEQRQTERDRRRDAVSETLDNQSEAIDQYYEDRLENEQALWTEISNMSETQITDLMTTYNEEYRNATDLNKAYMLLSYKQLHADIMSMMGNTEAATKATADYENYKRWMEKYADDPTVGSYDSAKTYSKGGLVDYTGWAVVHGSTSQPEAFLNASQTAMFSQLAQGLEAFYTRSYGFGNEKTDNTNSVVIENFTIEVDATLTDNNVHQTGESLADALLEGLRRTGISVNMKK